MTELLKESELKQYGLSPEVLLAKFNSQLYKDFEMCGLQTYLEPLTETAYEIIHRQLIETLKKIQNQNSQSLNNLIYRIDISEKQVSEKLKTKEGESYETILAELIIKRVLQKVVLKEIYSK